MTLRVMTLFMTGFHQIYPVSTECHAIFSHSCQCVMLAITHFYKRIMLLAIWGWIEDKRPKEADRFKSIKLVCLKKLSFGICKTAPVPSCDIDSRYIKQQQQRDAHSEGQLWVAAQGSHQLQPSALIHATLTDTLIVL